MWKEHHDEDTESETCDPLDETGYNSQSKDEQYSGVHEYYMFVDAKLLI